MVIHEIMKKRTTFVSLLLVCIMVFSVVSSAFGNFASATTGAANFLPNHFVAQTNAGETLDTANEMALSEDIADYVTLIFIMKGYDLKYDLRSSGCTSITCGNAISDLSNYDKGVIFSKGHRSAKTCAQQTAHVGLAMNDTDVLWDHDIGLKTGSQKIVHAFVWHCQTGIMPNGTNPDNCGTRGMPKAVTGNLGIDRWKTYGSQVYLGWTDWVPTGVSPITGGGSPQYEWLLCNANSVSYNYGDVAIWYYGLTGSHGYSTANALIMLSYMLYGTSFENSDLGRVENNRPGDLPWLEVYGNMYLELP